MRLSYKLRLRLEMRLAHTFHSRAHFSPKSETGSRNETECDYEITLRLCLLHFQMKLNNLHFTYKLDLSRVPCHCNAAAYFNKMPAHSPGEGGDWYCDANYVGGIG